MLQITCFGVSVSSHPGCPHNVCTSPGAACEVPTLCPILPPGPAGNATSDGGTRHHHSKTFIYTFTRFDLAVSPVLCHGAHVCSQGVLFSAPQYGCLVVSTSLCCIRDSGFTGDQQSLHLNVHHSSLLRAASSWPSILLNCTMKNQGWDIRFPTTERATLLLHLPTCKTGSFVPLHPVDQLLS